MHITTNSSVAFFHTYKIKIFGIIEYYMLSYSQVCCTNTVSDHCVVKSQSGVPLGIIEL